MRNSEEILNKFKAISLSEMEHVKLMDRTDTKFMFNSTLLPSILTELQKNYRVLEIGGKRICSYKTLYYDTDGFDCYRAHHNGKANRFKIRLRKYSDETGFLEVKSKNNKGRTVKTRVSMHHPDDIYEKSNMEFVASKVKLPVKKLKSNIWVNYQRITLVGEKDAERVTIDTQLSFRYSDKEYQMPGLVIAEIKRGGKFSSTAIKTMKKLKVKELSISKYCLGVTTVFPKVKKNNFKEKLKLVREVNGKGKQLKVENKQKVGL